MICESNGLPEAVKWYRNEYVITNDTRVSVRLVAVVFRYNIQKQILSEFLRIKISKNEASFTNLICFYFSSTGNKKSTLIIKSVQFADKGQFSCEFIFPQGSIASVPVNLSVRGEYLK